MIRKIQIAAVFIVYAALVSSVAVASTNILQSEAAENTAQATETVKSREYIVTHAQVQELVSIEPETVVEIEMLRARVQENIENERAKKPDYSTTRKQLSEKQLAQLLSDVGFKGKSHRLAWAIVMRESTGRPTAHNDNPRTGDNSYGLFQINMHNSLGPSRRDKFELKSNDELFNPVRNAEIAYYMSRGGEDFGAWGFGPNAYRDVGMAALDKFMRQYPGEPR